MTTSCGRKLCQSSVKWPYLVLSCQFDPFNWPIHLTDHLIWWDNRCSKLCLKKKIKYVNAFQRTVASQMSWNFPQKYVLTKDAMPEIKVGSCIFLCWHARFCFSEAILTSCCWLQLCALCKYLLGKTKENEVIKNLSFSGFIWNESLLRNCAWQLFRK